MRVANLMRCADDDRARQRLTDDARRPHCRRRQVVEPVPAPPQQARHDLSAASTGGMAAIQTASAADPRQEREAA
jgi:hypothetical protein